MTIPIEVAPCKHGCDRNSVILIQAGPKKNNTFMVECVSCQNATGVLPKMEAVEMWNKDFGKVA